MSINYHVERWESQGRYKIDPITNCWLWQRCCQTHGLPQTQGWDPIAEKRVSRLARHLIYEQFIGPIPPGHKIFSTCGNQKCIAPHHLHLKQPIDDYGSPAEPRKQPYKIDPTNNCWLWLMSLNNMGRPLVSRQFPMGGNRNCLATRALYSDKKGPIPKGSISSERATAASYA